MSIVLLIIAQIAISQAKLSNDFKVINSTPYKVVDAKMKEYFSDNNGNIYSIKTNNANVVIQKFDINTMKEVARKTYTEWPPYNKSLGILELGESFYYLYESLDKKTNKKTVYARQFITTDCTLDKQVKLFSSDGSVAMGPIGEDLGFWGMKGGAPFTIYRSFDDSKFMINYRRKPLLKRDAANHDLLGFFVFDTSLNKVWGREVKMPYTEKVMNNLAYTVGTDGTVYMMAFHRDDKSFKFITIPKEGDLTVTGLNKGDYMFQRLQMKENKDGNFDFLGYYANGLDYKFMEGNLSLNTNGITHFELSKKGEIIKSDDIEFPIDFINLYASNRQKNKNNKREKGGKSGIRDINLREFSVNPDGSMFVLGEQYYYFVVYNATSNSYTYKFYYEDLVATKISADGKVLWMKKLPKRQFGTSGRGGMGISYIKGKNSHYILFLDNVKNADIGIDEVPARHVDGKGGYLTAYKINDADGNYTKHTLYNSLEVNNVKTYQFKTSRIVKANDNTLVVEVYIKGKKDMIIKMELVE